MPDNGTWALPKIKGPPKIAGRIEESLGCYALIAAGVPGHGPWKLIAARYDLIKPSIATLNLGNWMRLTPGAIIMTDGDVFVKKLKAEAEEHMRAGSKLDAPWFLFAETGLAAALRRVALAAGVSAMPYQQYVARVEALVAKELS